MLDTNVISEIRKGQRCHQNVRAWFHRVNDADLYLSVIALGEIRRGIEILRRKDGSGAEALENWLNTLKTHYSERILNIQAAVADEWGRLDSLRSFAPANGLIAATALVHGLTLVTRNTSDFKGCPVRLLNPFDKESSGMRQA
ncbi:type II toxin-antitoxin system VapC family toxin [Oscillatoria laete-virens NRMC-F 0139]|nr:type II toxin-antitoxin system VapC family toxin [Oscillatoria laete-virens NRMC-F 0139]